MTLSTSALAYAPEYEALDAALSDPGRGVRIAFQTYAAAAHYRHRLHKARTIDRQRSTENASPGDPGYGTTAYDTLVCRLRAAPDNSRFFIYIERNDRAPVFEPITDEPTIEGLPPRVAFEPIPEVPRLEFVRRKL